MSYRVHQEYRPFSLALLRLREAFGWSQEGMGARLGLSSRTISMWEHAYAFPPLKNRFHIVLTLRDGPPALVIALAEGLGIAADPAVASFLQPYRDALAAPAPGQATPERLRAAVDAWVREAADGMNVAPNEVRAAIGRALEIALEKGATIEALREAVAVRGRARGAAGGS